MGYGSGCDWWLRYAEIKAGVKQNVVFPNGTPPKLKIDTKNDGLENVYIYILIYPFMNMAPFWGSMLNFRGVVYKKKHN